MNREHNPALLKAANDFIQAVSASVGANTEVFIVVEYGPEAGRVIACASSITDPMALVDLVGRAVGESAARLLELKRSAVDTSKAN